MMVDDPALELLEVGTATSWQSMQFAEAQLLASVQQGQPIDA